MDLSTQKISTSPSKPSPRADIGRNIGLPSAPSSPSTSPGAWGSPTSPGSWGTTFPTTPTTPTGSSGGGGGTTSGGSGGGSSPTPSATQTPAQFAKSYAESHPGMTAGQLLDVVRAREGLISPEYKPSPTYAGTLQPVTTTTQLHQPLFPGTPDIPGIKTYASAYSPFATNEQIVTGFTTTTGQSIPIQSLSTTQVKMLESEGWSFGSGTIQPLTKEEYKAISSPAIASTVSTTERKQLTIKDVFTSSGTFGDKAGTFSPISAPFAEGKLFTYIEKKSYKFGDYLTSFAPSGIRSVLKSPIENFGNIKSSSKFPFIITPPITLTIPFTQTKVYDLIPTPSVISRFALFAPAMITSTTGTVPIKSTTTTIAGETRTILGESPVTFKSGETSVRLKTATISETRGTAIIKTEIEGFKVSEYNLAKSKSYEISGRVKGGTFTFSKGEALVFENPITKGTSVSKFDIGASIFERTQKGDIVLGGAKVQTSKLGQGTMGKGGIPKLERVNIPEVKTEFYNVGSKPIKDIAGGELRKTGFTSVDLGKELVYPSSEGMGVLKIKYAPEPTTNIKDYFIKGLKSKKGSAPLSLSSPTIETKPSLSYGKTSISTLEFKQLGISESTITTKVGSYGLRSPLLLAGASVLSTQKVNALTLNTRQIFKTSSRQTQITQTSLISSQGIGLKTSNMLQTSLDTSQISIQKVSQTLKTGSISRSAGSPTSRFNIPRGETGIGIPFDLRFGGFEDSITSRKIKGGKRRIGYIPSFTAIAFKQKGIYKPGKLAKSGIDYRPITKGFKVQKGGLKLKI